MLLMQRNCIKMAKVLKQGSYENIQDPTLRDYVLQIEFIHVFSLLGYVPESVIMLK